MTLLSHNVPIALGMTVIPASVWHFLFKTLNIDLPYGPAIPPHSKGNERICPHKGLYTDVHGSFIYNWR